MRDFFNQTSIDKFCINDPNNPWFPVMPTALERWTIQAKRLSNIFLSTNFEFSEKQQALIELNALLRKRENEESGAGFLDKYGRDAEIGEAEDAYLIALRNG